MSVRGGDVAFGPMPGWWRWVRGVLFQARIFLKRGFVHNSSYRLNFSLSVVNVLVGLIAYYFLSKTVSASKLGEFADHPAAFIVVGTTVMTFVSVALASYAGSIRSEMFLGTIEHWLLSTSSLTRLVALSTIWEFAWPLITTVITFTVLSVALSVTLDPNWLTTLVFFLLTIVVMSGFGLISAGIIMVSKIGDPLSTAWGVVTSLLSGSLFPITVLPGWMQGLSHALPPYYALEGLRHGLVLHASLSDERSALFYLLGFAIAIVPLGVVAFRLGFERARAQGTLAQF